MSHFIIQLIMLVITALFVTQQFYATWAYREFVPPHNIKSKRLHVSNWLLVASIGLAISTPLLQAQDHPLWKFLIVSLINGVIFTTIFDPAYAMSIGNNPFYLGNEAQSDQAEKKLFGKYAGYFKAGIGLTLIYLGNFLYQTLF